MLLASNELLFKILIPVIVTTLGRIVLSEIKCPVFKGKIRSQNELKLFFLEPRSQAHFDGSLAAG